MPRRSAIDDDKMEDVLWRLVHWASQVDPSDARALGFPDGMLGEFSEDEVKVWLTVIFAIGRAFEEMGSVKRADLIADFRNRPKPAKSIRRKK
jgi:hypothetical protein